MKLHRGRPSTLVLVALAAGTTTACVPKSKPTSAHSLARADGKPVFAVLPADSPEFPVAARTVTDRLRRARIKGYDAPAMSKVSMEVVQLSIECVDPTPACYAAVGKELAASQMLFAKIDAGKKKESVKVTVTLFDVVEGTSKRAATKTFPSEDDVPFGIADVIDEATRP